MTASAFWPVLIYFILSFVMLGYILLDGYDLGLGMALWFVKKKEDQHLLFSSIAPVWDGNEVWLVISGTLLFAAFPRVYAAVLSGYYFFVMLLIYGLILRAVSFEFWFHDRKRQALWGNLFSAGSLLIALLLALLVGQVIAGVALTPTGGVAHATALLLRPFPLAVMLLGGTAVYFQGLSYGILKTGSALQQALLKLARRTGWFYPAAIILFIVLKTIYLPRTGSTLVFWAGMTLAVLALATAAMRLARQQLNHLFLLSSLCLTGLWVSLVGVQFPVLVRSLNAAQPGLTLFNAASSVPVLKLLAGFFAVLMPLILFSTWLVYRVFRGKTGNDQTY